jgi:hypothetical protein
MPGAIRNVCAFRSETLPKGKAFREEKTMNWKKFQLFGRDWIENSFKPLVDRKNREQHRNERRLAEQRTTKHRLQARKSCIADARTYRIARRLTLFVNARFD